MSSWKQRITVQGSVGWLTLLGFAATLSAQPYPPTNRQVPPPRYPTQNTQPGVRPVAPQQRPPQPQPGQPSRVQQQPGQPSRVQQQSGQPSRVQQQQGRAPATRGPGQAPPAAAARPHASPFQLTPRQQADLEFLLNAWEAKSSKIKNLKCKFTVWEFDPVFQKSTQRAGDLMYQAPDKGYYRVQWERVTNTKGEANWIEKKNLPHWLCNGDSIFQVKHHEKKIVEHQLPE
ncbi:MAG: hypothetical protein N2C14_22070, partial [Planctomycetales bacterium]